MTDFKKKRFEPSKLVTDDIKTSATEEWHSMRRYEKVDCDANSVAIDPPVIMRSRANDPGGVAAAIRAGSSVNAFDCFGFTAAHWACKYGHEEVLKVLIECKADLNKGDLKKRTPLMLASADGHLSLVQDLIRAGAGVNLQTVLGWTALMYASASGHCKVINFLLKRGASAAHVAGDGSSALTWASAAGHVEASSMVMSAGAPKKDFL